MAFDLEDTDCFNFIYSTANLFAFNCGIKGYSRNSKADRDAVKAMAMATTSKEYRQ